MDGIIGLEGNGPGSGGTPKRANLLLVSKDAPSLDYVASEIIGYNPKEIYTNKICIKRGLLNTEEIEIIGEKRVINFKKPVNVSKAPLFLMKFIFNQVSMKPYAIKKNCTRCKKCHDICPVSAISMQPYPQIDNKKCINCYCCHEICPHNAMDLKGSLIFNLITKLKDKFQKR